MDFLEVMKDAEALVRVGITEGADQAFEQKLAKFVEVVTNARKMPKHRREYLMREAESTSDFPNLFGTVLERTLLAKYNNITPDYRSYIKVGRQNDFRSAQLLQVYGLQSAMDEVKQLGEYPGAALGDGKYTISLKKYGRQFPLAWEAVINDDLGAFADTAQRLAQAAVATENIQAVKAFVSATGGNTTLYQSGGTHPIDGASFTNTSALSITGGGATAISSIESVITALKNQKDVDGNPILITKFHMVVPPERYIDALRALSTAALISVGVGNSAATQSSENVIAKLPITLHVNEYLTSVDTSANNKYHWYMFADPQADGAAAQLNFLAGHEAPEICMKRSDKISTGGGEISALEGNFQNDSMAWRVRHVLGTTQLDPRFTYYSSATS